MTLIVPTCLFYKHTYDWPSRYKLNIIGIKLFTLNRHSNYLRLRFTILVQMRFFLQFLVVLILSRIQFNIDSYIEETDRIIYEPFNFKYTRSKTDSPLNIGLRKIRLAD